jgi:murein DD-endopeptidase MepM/ murein hydrolase activator NlpD
MRANAFFLVFFLLLAIPLAATHADDAANLQAQIDDHNAKIQALQNEIAAYQGQLNTLGTTHKTLQSAIQTLNVTSAQTGSQIKLTQNQIATSDLKLREISGQISAKEYEIELDKRTLAQSIREMDTSEGTSLAEQIFSAGTFADAWVAVDTNASLNQALNKNTSTLVTAKTDLVGKENTEQSAKDKLTSLNSQLVEQQQQLKIAESEKTKLLAQTKNQESTYQSLIAQKQAQQKSFEGELSQLQADLKSVGSASIPTVGSGVLKWPFSAAVEASCQGKAKALSNPYCITQYFGNTDFSTANPQIYNGMGHDGVDIGVPTGTSVQAALSGTVLATGNTDAVPGCYSFGKYVVLTHPNGLATLYAHLSVIGVSKGQTVATGQVIGNSGMTGYATGPHLHFGVYAAAGIQIMDLGAWRRQSGIVPTSPCAKGGAVIPVAPVNAYLNPLSYLL